MNTPDIEISLRSAIALCDRMSEQHPKRDVRSWMLGYRDGLERAYELVTGDKYEA